MNESNAGRGMISRREFILASGALWASASARGMDQAHGGGRIKPPDKTVVLTFDDAVKSHRNFVAPLLKELGLDATFFITQHWMDDSEHFMTWREIAEIHAMGFEIGNHSWTHPNFGNPKVA